MVHVKELLSLQGKSALVTGANGGIGRAMATALAEAGADVVIFQIPGDTDDTTAQEIKQTGQRTQTYDCDLANPSEIRTVMGKVFADGWKLDVLVNCAGISKHCPILDMTDELKDRNAQPLIHNKLISINLNAPYIISQEFCRHVISRSAKGSIINVSSMAGKQASKNISVYAATKGGIIQMTQAFANEFGSHGIRANAICPSYILTPLTQPHFDRPDFRQEKIGKCPLGRWGVPEDFKAITVFLASEGSGFVSGTAIEVDGGTHGT